jgi:hypothetical protein
MNALYSNTTGVNNSAVGFEALRSNTSGSYNNAVGNSALYSNTTGIENSAIGDNAGYNNTTGTYNTFLGANTNISPTSATWSNSTAIGANALITASNQITLGTATQTVHVPGNVGIGMTAPTAKLDVNGNVQAWEYTATSDYRIKDYVTSLSDCSFTVDVLRPVSYHNKLSDKPDIGLIAHEVQEHFPFLVSGEKDGETMQSVNYTGLIGLLIHEIKQLKRRVSDLEQHSNV